jgi:hypothetical protein
VAHPTGGPPGTWPTEVVTGVTRWGFESREFPLSPLDLWATIYLDAGRKNWLMVLCGAVASNMDATYTFGVRKLLRVFHFLNFST